MAIHRVYIEEVTASCVERPNIYPDVFEMPDEAKVKEATDICANEDWIKEADESYPVEMIKYE